MPEMHCRLQKKIATGTEHVAPLALNITYNPYDLV